MPYITQERRRIIETPEFFRLIDRAKNDYHTLCDMIELICNNHRYGLSTYRDHSCDFIYEFVSCAGDLNYVITRLLWSYLQNARYNDYAMTSAYLEKLKSTHAIGCAGCRDTKGMEVVGVLSNIPDETYVRKITPYEDLKIKENGNV